MEEKLKLHEMLYPLGLLDAINTMRADIAKKADAADGKGFSANDFTDECVAAVNGAVRFDTAQSLKKEQKETVINNIGAFASEKYSSKSVDDLLNFADALKQQINIWISFDETSPAELFGGTWERISGRFLFASDDTHTVNSSGGSVDAALVSHTHDLKMLSAADGVMAEYGLYLMRGNNGKLLNLASATTTYGSKNYFALSTEGESSDEKNMPPYITVNMWKRIA